MPEDPIKDALGMMPYGFYAISSRAGDDANIMVANWVMQASFEPRRMVLGLQKTSYSYGLVQAGKVFAINIFKKTGAEAIKPFTKSRMKNPAKMEMINYTPGPETGCPILEGAAAYLELRVLQIVDVAGDHDLVVGEVVGAGVRDPGEAGESLSLPDLGWNYSG